MVTSANGTVIKLYTPGEVRLRVTARLNVRDAPTRTAKRVGRRELNERMLASQLLLAETYLDNPYWYRLDGAAEQYVWAGGVVSELLPSDDGVANPALVVNRRSDGTIRPLSEADLMQRYGPFTYKDRPNGLVAIAPPWERVHIAVFAHPLLARFDLQQLRVHKRALPAFKDVFDAIAQADSIVSACLRTCGGTFVPRHIQWNPKKPLSSHAFGVAIDLNERWNGYGKQPAPRGTEGSVQELVPYFARSGFAWGGHFSESPLDGMHFELALT